MAQANVQVSADGVVRPDPEGDPSNDSPQPSLKPTEPTLQEQRLEERLVEVAKHTEILERELFPVLVDRLDAFEGSLEHAAHYADTALLLIPSRIRDLPAPVYREISPLLSHLERQAMRNPQSTALAEESLAAHLELLRQSVIGDLKGLTPQLQAATVELTNLLSKGSELFEQSHAFGFVRNSQFSLLIHPDRADQVKEAFDTAIHRCRLLSEDCNNVQIISQTQREWRDIRAALNLAIRHWWADSGTQERFLRSERPRLLPEANRVLASEIVTEQDNKDGSFNNSPNSSSSPPTAKYWRSLRGQLTRCVGLTLDGRVGIEPTPNAHEATLDEQRRAVSESVTGKSLATPSVDDSEFRAAQLAERDAILTGLLDERTAEVLLQALEKSRAAELFGPESRTPVREIITGRHAAAEGIMRDTYEMTGDQAAPLAAAYPPGKILQLEKKRDEFGIPPVMLRTVLTHEDSQAAVLLGRNSDPERFLRGLKELYSTSVGLSHLCSELEQDPTIPLRNERKLRRIVNTMSTTAKQEHAKVNKHIEGLTGTIEIISEVFGTLEKHETDILGDAQLLSDWMADLLALEKVSFTETGKRSSNPSALELQIWAKCDPIIQRAILHSMRTQRGGRRAVGFFAFLGLFSSGFRDAARQGRKRVQQNQQTQTRNLNAQLATEKKAIINRYERHTYIPIEARLRTACSAVLVPMHQFCGYIPESGEPFDPQHADIKPLQTELNQFYTDIGLKRGSTTIPRRDLGAVLTKLHRWDTTDLKSQGRAGRYSFELSLTTYFQDLLRYRASLMREEDPNANHQGPKEELS